MASPFSYIHCLRRIRFSRCSPIVIGCVVSHDFLTPVRRDSLGWPTVNFAPDELVHLCGIAEWSRARRRGGIRPDGSRSGVGSGFIHLSTPEQVHLPANRLYRGRDDLVLLHIDPALLESPVRWEPGVETDPESMLFPHLYGRLPVRAVINVTAYPPGPDGTFPPVPEPQDPVGDST